MTEGTLLGMQLIYGISQSLARLKCPDVDTRPVFFSTNIPKEYLEDLHLDILIAQCTQLLTRKYVSGKISSNISNTFAQAFFNFNKVACRDYPNNIYEKLPLSSITNKTDELICKEAVYYSNRTNALHFRTNTTNSDETNVLFLRLHNSIEEYFETDTEKKNIQSVGDLLDLPVNNMLIRYVSDFDETIRNGKEKQLCAIDLSFLTEKDMPATLITELIGKARRVSKVLVVILPENMPVPKSLTDIAIDMKSKTVNDYMLQYLSITQNKIQLSALGWHQYKRRDYGIEVYPSLHTYFQQRRYLQRALVYTHSDVITDTYQQYIDKNGDAASYESYQSNYKSDADEYYKALYPQYCSDYTSVDILERILLSDTSNRNRPCGKLHAKDHIYEYYGGVTAVIGEANTYKRFLTFGGIFSSALHEEHTLLLLLNKDDSTIRRRLACPARTKRGDSCDECRNCYRYIHFMNICMGNITPDEFIYFLEYQINTSFNCQKKIRRIIIDDLQILDFCFPLLKDNSLFISALVAVCREHNIALYILCDKTGNSVNALRAVADNVICTDRDENGKLLVYIERFAGYNNTPSKIYCGRIKKVKDLFECYKKRDEKEQDTAYYSLSSMQIEDQPVSSLDGYWMSSDGKAIAKLIKHK